MIDYRRLEEFLDELVSNGTLHDGQKKDVISRANDSARHLLLDKRAEMRRLMGKRRVSYAVAEIELIASYRLRRVDGSDDILTEEFITQVIAKSLNLPFLILDPLQLDYKLVTETFGGPFAERHLVVTLENTEEYLRIAMAEPWNIELLESIRNVKGKPVHPVMSSKGNILRVIAEFHGFRSSMRAAEAIYGHSYSDIGNLEQLHILSEAGDLDAEAQPVVQAVWYILNYAFENRVSDIHLEPKREESWVRMRIDGVLHRVHRMPKVVHPAVVSRMKMLGRLDIAERRRPQDGRFKTQYRNSEVEIRISTAPTAFGEKLVARIFDPGVLIQDLDHIGMFPIELQQFKQMLGSNTGLVLVVGPTGSGKTTTLYSSLNYLSSPRLNIVTLEDPIEMVHEQFNQIAIQPKIGLTFAHALRTVLRQDPDVVMVGEIRDEETAQNVVQAAMTGHMVISTIHTGEASSAVGRMLDLGILPFLLSSVLVGVVAQRLVRKICPFCAVDDYLTDEQIQLLRIQGVRGRKLKTRKGKGCVKCRYTGYSGRSGIFEVMPITPRLERLINEKSSTQDIKREALNDGMLTLREYGIKKVAKGDTTVEEVLSLTDERPIY